MGTTVFVGVTALILGLCGGLVLHYRSKAIAAKEALSEALAGTEELRRHWEGEIGIRDAEITNVRAEGAEIMRQTLAAALEHAKAIQAELAPKAKKTNIVFPPYMTPEQGETSEASWAVPLDQVLSVDPETGEPLEVQPF